MGDCSSSGNNECWWIGTGVYQNEIRKSWLRSDFFALLFILPGLAGLIISAMISTHYLEVMPRGPVLVEGRIVPREIHGIVVYQTADEKSPAQPD